MERIDEIAQRLFAMRDLVGVSEEELCEHLSISPEEYKQIETGRVDIPISVLCEAAAYYNIGVTELLTGEKAKLKMYSLVRNNRGIGVQRTDDYDYKSLAYDFVNRKVEPLMVTVGHKERAELHPNSHQGHEFHYCISGGYRFYIDDHEVIVNEGDSLYFESKYPHAMSSVGDMAKILVIVI